MVLLAVAASVVVSAQGGRTPSGGGGGAAQAAALQALADKLRLNERTQIPEVETVFTAAARAALPVSLQLSQARRSLYNAMAEGTPDEGTAARDALVAATARMTTIETDAFQRVFDLLEPKQQNKAAEAYTFMAGLFKTAPRPGRGSGRGGVQ